MKLNSFWESAWMFYEIFWNKLYYILFHIPNLKWTFSCFPVSIQPVLPFIFFIFVTAMQTPWTQLTSILFLYQRNHNQCANLGDVPLVNWISHSRCFGKVHRIQIATPFVEQPRVWQVWALYRTLWSLHDERLIERHDIMICIPENQEKVVMFQQ